MTRLLIVDDEPHVLTALQRALRRRFGDRLMIESHTNAATALARAREVPFEIVISDQRMPEIDGVTFLTLMTAVLPGCIRLMLTGSADFEMAQRAINDAGVFRYLSKPWNDAQLASNIEAAMAQLELAAKQNQASLATDELDPQGAERRRLEALEPGITAVEWGPEGEVLLAPAEQRTRVGNSPSSAAGDCRYEPQALPASSLAALRR